MENSASRLLELLEKGKAFPKNKSCADAWKFLLGVERDIEIPERLGHFYRLVGQAAEDVIRSNPAAAGGVDHWRSRIYSAIENSKFGNPWENFINQIDSHTFNYLRLQSDSLDSKRPTKKLNKDHLKKARDFLEKSLDEIRESSLPGADKINLIAKIQSVIFAIDNYDILGQEAVFDSMKIAAFDYANTSNKHQEMPGQSNVREGLAILADLMSMADGAIALTGPITHLLKSL